MSRTLNHLRRNVRPTPS